MRLDSKQEGTGGMFGVLGRAMSGCGKLAIIYLHVGRLELGQLDVWCLTEWWSTMEQ